MSLCRTLIILNLTVATALCGLSALSIAQGAENDCLSCHKKVYELGASYKYQHAPFKKRECGACHLQQRADISGKDLVEADAGIEYATAKNRCSGLNVGKGLSIDACYRCHPPDVLGLSHPVGVAAGATTKIPDYLPVLAGDIISCVTCHNVHGGSMKHFVRRTTTRCNVCHKG